MTLASDTTIELKNFRADMGTHALKVEGALTLTDIQTITGSGEAVISLQGAGTLTLVGTKSGTISNTNSTMGYYAIAVKDLSNSAETHLLWENENLTIESKKGTEMGTRNMYIIQGCSTDENDKYVLSEWVKCKKNYSVKATQGSGIASLVK